MEHEKLFERARRVTPGGVNSPVRSYPHMGCPPPFIREAHGSHITDIDGNFQIKVYGVKGTDCKDLTAEIEAIIGNELLESELTEEYFEQKNDENLQQTQRT